MHPTPSLPLSSVLYLPQFPFNLMSVSKLTKKLSVFRDILPRFLYFPESGYEEDDW